MPTPRLVLMRGDLIQAKSVRLISSFPRGRLEARVEELDKAIEVPVPDRLKDVPRGIATAPGTLTISDERVVAVALLTQANVDQLGQALSKAWLVEDVPCFGGLLRGIDDADRNYWRTRDEKVLAPSE